MSKGPFSIRQLSWKRDRGGDNQAVIVEAGYQGTEHIVPPAGEQYAFDREKYKRRIEVYVSPTGRSVRVWVDGKEVPHDTVRSRSRRDARG